MTSIRIAIALAVSAGFAANYPREASADIPAGNVFPNPTLEQFTGAPVEATATPVFWTRAGSIPGGLRYSTAKSVSPSHSLNVTESSSDFVFWWSNDFDVQAALPNVAFVNVHWHQAYRVTNGLMRFSVILGQNRLTAPGPSEADFVVQGTSPGFDTGAFISRTETFYLPTSRRHMQLQVVSGGEGSAMGEFYVDDISVTPITAPAAQILIPATTAWRYFDTGFNPGVAWRDPLFNDSLWPIGLAKLGYGDGDEATVVACGPSGTACNANNHATTYFRRTFSVANSSDLADPKILLARDDAAAVYVNGVEVYRDSGLPANPAFDAYSTSSAARDNAVVTFTFDRDILHDGSNVIAVEVHQVAHNSSDLAFDLQMEAELQPIPEPGSFVIAGFGGLFLAIAASQARKQRTPSRGRWPTEGSS